MVSFQFDTPERVTPNETTLTGSPPPALRKQKARTGMSG
jgi:hypothetical protein